MVNGRESIVKLITKFPHSLDKRKIPIKMATFGSI